ncbi:hypothetical protein P171DRAFT_486721 [Karstenula rhodostoma CBS 690.94]|uniref:IBR domain-containing protein n=1 Tax=Karstenula rhodostoma CBS 690.94 TaxID=1392251 RepID=A0A9P4PGV4_9PLEO|nr:hypothetical protein P171DRAFT_486721 [Karstenula rhodostoma CBS 690.94]
MAADFDAMGPAGVVTGCADPGCEAMWYVRTPPPPLRLLPTLSELTLIPYLRLRSAEFIAAWFPKFLLNKWAVALNDLVLSHPESPIVACPSCGHRGLVDGPYPGWPQVECASSDCKARFCVKCLDHWHPYAPCAGWAHEDEVTTVDLPPDLVAK